MSKAARVAPSLSAMEGRVVVMMVVVVVVVWW